MRVITINLNGIRSATKKGFFDWVLTQNADFICVQETRAHVTANPNPTWQPEPYFCYFQDAFKPGYSGVGIYSKYKPQKIITKLGWDTADNEGRYIELEFPNFSIASLYMPSGTSGEMRQGMKYDFLERYFKKLKEIAEGKRDFIIAGDFNIAHKQIDLKNWRSNQNHTGFLPKERAWFDRIIDDLGLVDAFRVINQEAGQYTWWSNFGHAWENNTGWRIDYEIVTKNLKPKITAANIYKDLRFSDHSPLIIDYDYKLA